MKVGDVVRFKCNCGHSIPLTAIGLIVKLKRWINPTWPSDEIEIDFYWNKKITKINSDCLEVISNDR